MSIQAQTAVRKIPLSLIDPFKDHPFRVRDDEEMDALVQSIKENGVLVPIAVREKGDRYELISGHRRAHACERAGLSEIPAMVLPMDDDAAIIAMVDSNLQREHILPSEKAFAYKMKNDALKRKAGRQSKGNWAPVGPNFPENGPAAGIDNLSSQQEPKLRTSEIIANDVGESRNQVKRYIRLTYLLPDLLNLVDDGTLPFRTGVELSYLTPENQDTVLRFYRESDRLPSLEQAERLKGGKDLPSGEFAALLHETFFPAKKPSVKAKEERGEERNGRATAPAEPLPREDISDEEIERRGEEAERGLREELQKVEGPRAKTVEQAREERIRVLRELEKGLTPKIDPNEPAVDPSVILTNDSPLDEVAAHPFAKRIIERPDMTLIDNGYGLILKEDGEVFDEYIVEEKEQYYAFWRAVKFFEEAYDKEKVYSYKSTPEEAMLYPSPESYEKYIADLDFYVEDLNSLLDCNSTIRYYMRLPAPANEDNWRKDLNGYIEAYKEMSEHEQQNGQQNGNE